MANVTIDEIDAKIQSLEGSNRVTLDEVDAKIQELESDGRTESGLKEKLIEGATSILGVGSIPFGVPELAKGKIEQIQETAGTIAPSLLPVIDKERFKTTPVFEAAGDIAGGLGGTAIGGIPGGVAGSGLLGAFGRAIDDQIRSMQRTLSPEEETFLGRLENAGESGVLSMLGESVPLIFKPIAKRFLAPFKGAVSNRGKNAIKFAREHGDILEDVFGRKSAIPFTPASVTEVKPSSALARVLDVAENIVEKSILGAGSVLRLKEKSADVNAKILRSVLDGIDQTSLEPREMGELLREAASRNDKILNGIINRWYTAVNNRVKNLRTTAKVKINDFPLSFDNIDVGIVRLLEPKKTAREVAKLGQSISKIGDSEQGFTLAEKILSIAKENMGHVDYESAQTLRSSLSSILRNREVAKETGPINRTLVRLINDIDNSIESALRRRDPKALKMWKKGKELRAKRGLEFQNDLIVKLLDTVQNKTMLSAKDFTDQFLGVGDALDVDRIKTIKTAVGKDTWQKAKRFVTQKLLVDASDTGASQSLINAGKLGRTEGEDVVILNGDKLERLLTGRGGMGKEILEEIYTPSEIKNLKGVANSMIIGQAKQGDGTGGMFIQLTQGGAVLGVGGVRKSAAILGLPLAVSKLFVNPVTQKWLIEGFSAPPGSTQMVQAFTKLSAAITNLNLQEQKRKARVNNPRLRVSSPK